MDSLRTLSMHEQLKNNERAWTDKKMNMHEQPKNNKHAEQIRINMHEHFEQPDNNKH